MFYSAESGGFYHDGQIRPSDAIEVDDDIYASLLQGQAQGRAIVSGSDGTPVFSATVDPSLDDVKAARICGALTAACAAAIVDGYKSSALGSSHIYPSAITDQINMMGSVTASLLPGLPVDWTTPFWCKDEASGQWAFRPHDATQIQQAGAVGKAHIVECQARLEQLSAQVMAAASAEAVAAIVWDV